MPFTSLFFKMHSWIVLANQATSWKHNIWQTIILVSMATSHSIRFFASWCSCKHSWWEWSLRAVKPKQRAKIGSLTCHVAGFCQWGLNPRGPRSGCQGQAFRDCHFHPQKVNFSPADESRHHLETSLHCKHRWGELVSGSGSSSSSECRDRSIGNWCSSSSMFHWSHIDYFLYYSKIRTKTLFKLWLWFLVEEI